MANYNITLTVSGRDIRQVTKHINYVLNGNHKIAETGLSILGTAKVEKQDRNCEVTDDE